MARYAVEVPMRWGDMDAFRHVNNVIYLRYLEQTRIAVFEKAFGGFSGGVIIAHQEISYLRPVLYSSTPLRIETWVSRIGTSSFTFSYEVFDPASGDADPAAKASVVCVMFDYETNATRPLTALDREQLEKLSDDGAD